jgi:hypothetical protein
MMWDSSHEVAASEPKDRHSKSHTVDFQCKMPESGVYCTASWPTLVQGCVHRLGVDVRDGHEGERDKHGVSLLGSNRFAALAFISTEQNKLSLHLRNNT